MAKKEKAAPSHHIHIRPRLSASAWLLIILSGIIGLAYVPLSVLILAGMMPTIIAFLFDQDGRRSPTVTIGLMNAAGVSPFVLKLWENGKTIESSLAMLKHGTTWLVMYGSAVGGWGILYIVPPIVHVIMVQKARHRMAELEKRQVILRTAWGEEVENPSSPV
jgi:hypothetical protein